MEWVNRPHNLFEISIVNFGCFLACMEPWRVRLFIGALWWIIYGLLNCRVSSEIWRCCLSLGEQLIVPEFQPSYVLHVCFVAMACVFSCSCVFADCCMRMLPPMTDWFIVSLGSSSIQLPKCTIQKGVCRSRSLPHNANGTHAYAHASHQTPH